jgi:hypothetical protein
MLAERTTGGSLWHAMTGRPLSADLLDWPPDLFALTSLMLQRSGAYRFALSPPPGRQWPPGSGSGWSTTVEAAGRAWSGVVDASGEPIPPLLVSMMEVVVAAATTPLEELSTGADWDLCAALLTLHAIADEACAGLGAALSASNPIGCGYRGRARELLAQRGTLRANFAGRGAGASGRCARPQPQEPPSDPCLGTRPRTAERRRAMAQATGPSAGHRASRRPCQLPAAAMAAADTRKRLSPHRRLRAARC